MLNHTVLLFLKVPTDSTVPNMAAAVGTFAHTAMQPQWAADRNTSTALVPPNANELDSMVRADFCGRAMLGT